MTIASSQNMSFDTDAAFVSPVSISSPWQLAIAPTATGFSGTAASDAGPDGLDAATITAPLTDITKDTRRISVRGSKGGTNMMVRLGYPTATTISTPCKMAIFGRYRFGTTTEVDVWIRLYSKSGNNYVSFASAATDISDGTLKYTAVDPQDNIFDMLGCTEFIFGTEQAVALASATNISKCLVQFKVI